MESPSQKIAQLNDAFHQSMGQGGQVYMTRGIQKLLEKDRLEVLKLVKTFNDFSEGNDPYGEYDFGSIDYKEDKVFWKVNYYDPDMVHGSEDPGDPEKTVWVMMAYGC